MILKIKPTDPLSWLAHSAGMLAIMGIITLIGSVAGLVFSGDFTVSLFSVTAGYSLGLLVYFHKERHETGTEEIWKWKFDSIMDFVCPAIVGGFALRYIERIM